MYGFPLTIYRLSGWLQAHYPKINLVSHDAVHLWWTLTGQHGNPHTDAVHMVSLAFIAGRFWLLSAAWRVLHHAQGRGAKACTGIHARIRHPQYVAFELIMFGFLLQWPTVLTVLMFPVLTVMYVRLSLTEEKDSARTFGAGWQAYSAATLRFLPRWRRRQSA